MALQQQRFRPLQPLGQTMPAAQGVATQPTAGPAPIDTTLPGAAPTAPTAPLRPKPQMDPMTGDPIFGKPTVSPPGTTQNPLGTTPTTQPVQPNGYRPGPTPTAPSGSLPKPQITGFGTPQNPGTVSPITPRPPAVGVQPTPIATKPIAPETSPVGQNLRGDVYTPGDDPRLSGAMTASDTAAGRVQGINRGGMQAGNEGRYRSLYGDGQVSGAMDELTGAPDRTALAMQKLKDFDAVSNEQRFNEERSLGQNIAKFGRIGMQSNAGDFGEITRKIAGDRGRLANELVRDVSEGDINDRFRRVDMKTGLAERNADRGFQRTSAAVNTATGQTDRSIGDAFDQLDAAGSLEDRIFGQGQSNRGEMRTERGRQDTQAQQTIENRLREFEIQQQLEDAKIRRAAALATAGGGY